MPLTTLRHDADAASRERVAPPVGPLENERPRILAALRRGNDAKIRALHRLDPEPLDDAFTGEALRLELAAVQDLVAAGVQRRRRVRRARAASRGPANRHARTTRGGLDRRAHPVPGRVAATGMTGLTRESARL